MQQSANERALASGLARSAPRWAPEAIVTALAVLAVGIAGVRLAPGEALRPWLFFAAAETTAITWIDQLEALGEAIRQNALAWRLVTVGVVGVVAGVAANWVVPGRRLGGLFSAAMLGLFGAVMGSWACASLGYSLPNGISAVGLVVAFVASALTLVLGRALARF